MKQETTMKINVVSGKLVKPWKPTPPHLNPYKISLIDELNPPMHVTRVLYYSSDDVVKQNHILLEESLAQVLPLFYPLAGRYNKEKHQVDCNDEGAEFLVAEVNCKLDQLIGAGVKPEHLNPLLPQEIGAVDEHTDPMLAVQISRFQCGGLAIGVCASHRIFDAYSVGIFLKAWANAATDGALVICPDFDSPLYFPLENQPPLYFGMSRTINKSIVTKRFAFDKNAISKLRERIGTEWELARSERPPSRVVVVSAVLTQALLRADKAKHGKSRASLMAQAINVRERTVPPISKYACGSWVSNSHLDLSADEGELMAHDYPGMVLKMREATIRGVEECERLLSDKEFGRWVLIDSNFVAAQKVESSDYRVVWITDWSKFGEYELDFGFGKPVWVSIVAVPFEDIFTLLNTRNNDGIEAWVCLHESDMQYFEQDEELRMLTTQ